MPESILHPESLLLCLQAQADLTPLQALGENDWWELVRQASWTGLLPLVNRRLSQPGISLLVPSEVSRLLQGAYLRTLAENTLRYRHLAEALKALQDEGIVVLLLKGAYLAEKIYGDIGLRPMNDFDLLVPRSQLLKTLELLKHAGFEPEREYFEEGDGALHFHAPPMHKNGTVLEIHWDLSRPDEAWSADVAAFWQRAIPLQMQDGRALALAPVDLLLHMCVHASYHHTFFNQLRSLCDIREMLAMQEGILDWQAFISIVEGCNAGKGVYLSLRLAMELLGVAVPGQVLSALEPPCFDPRTLEWAYTQLFRQTPPLSANFERVMRKGSLRALLAGLFPPLAVMAMIYGFSARTWWLPLLYPYTAVNRLVRYAKPALEVIRRNPRRIQETDSSLNLLDWLGEKR